MAAEILPKLDRFARVFPILRWLLHYERRWFRADVIAGLTLWGILVPEGIAYASLAGAPVQGWPSTHFWPPSSLRHFGNNALGERLVHPNSATIQSAPGRQALP